MKRLTDRDRLEQIFTHATQPECISYLEYAALIVRLRFPAAQQKRGRKRKATTQVALTEAK